MSWKRAITSQKTNSTSNNYNYEPREENDSTSTPSSQDLTKHKNYGYHATEDSDLANDNRVQSVYKAYEVQEESPVVEEDSEPTSQPTSPKFPQLQKDWNAEFQKILELPETNEKEATEKAAKLAELAHDFCYAAQVYVFSLPLSLTFVLLLFFSIVKEI